MPARIAVMARDAGAAAALAPVVRFARDRGDEASIIAYSKAAAAFERAGLGAPATSKPQSEADAAGLLQAAGATALLTGTSLKVEEDSYFWNAARSQGMPSVALLDHWRNYGERFTVKQPFDRLPDRVCVMDEAARQALLDEGCPADAVVVTGHPYLDSIEPVSEAERDAARSELGIDPGRAVVLFASEPKTRFGTVEGEPDERESFRLVATALAEADPEALLLAKLHPLERDWAPVGAQLAADVTPRQAVAAVDVVVGMTSIILLEAAIAGRPTFTVTPPECDGFLRLHADRISATPSVGDLSPALSAALAQAFEAPPTRPPAARMEAAKRVAALLA